MFNNPHSVILYSISALMFLSGIWWLAASKRLQAITEIVNYLRDAVAGIDKRTYNMHNEVIDIYNAQRRFIKPMRRHPRTYKRIGRGK